MTPRNSIINLSGLRYNVGSVTTRRRLTRTPTETLGRLRDGQHDAVEAHSPHPTGPISPTPSGQSGAVGSVSPWPVVRLRTQATDQRTDALAALRKSAGSSARDSKHSRLRGPTCARRTAVIQVIRLGWAHQVETSARSFFPETGRSWGSSLVNPRETSASNAAARSPALSERSCADS